MILAACALAVLAPATLAFALGVRRGRTAPGRAVETQRDLLLRLNHLEALLEADTGRIFLWTGARMAPLAFGARAKRHIPIGRKAAHAEFAAWLSKDSLAALAAALEALKSAHTPFELRLRSRSGMNVHASGFFTGMGHGVKFYSLAETKGEAGKAQPDTDTAPGTAPGLMRALLEGLDAPAWQQGDDGRPVWVNPSWCKAVGLASLEEALKEGADFPGATGRAEIARGRDGAGRFCRNMTLVSAGQRRQFAVNTITLGGQEAGIAIDISETGRLQAELERVGDFHARTLNQLATAVAIFGGDQKLQFYNASFRQLWAFDDVFLESRPRKGELLDHLRAARKLPEQADYRAWRDTVLESFREPNASESLWHLPDGRHLRVIANPHPRGGVTWVYEDVSERLRLESRYNSLIRVQGETLDHLSEAIAVFSSDGRLRLWNPAFSAIWGLDAHFLGDNPHVSALVAACGGTGEVYWQNLTAAVTGLADNRTARQGRMERPDDIIYDYATIPLPDGGTLFSLINVTDSVRVARALTERAEALEASDRLKNDFIQHVSYELRTPLTNITGFSQLLGDPAFGDLSRVQRDYLDHILASSDVLMALVNDILDLATIDAGIAELDLSEVDMADCVAAAIGALDDRIKKAGIRLDNRVPPDIGVLQADERRLRQIIYNILSNAVQFSPHGECVGIGARRDAGFVYLAVWDVGSGIPKRLGGAIFDRFVSSDPRQKKRRAGLGMAIVKSFVELHGGRIEIDTLAPHGTQITCIFPVRQSHDKSQEQIQGQEPGQGHRDNAESPAGATTRDAHMHTGPGTGHGGRPASS